MKDECQAKKQAMDRWGAKGAAFCVVQEIHLRRSSSTLFPFFIKPCNLNKREKRQAAHLLMEERISIKFSSPSLQVQPKQADGTGQAYILKAIIVGLQK